MPPIDTFKTFQERGHGKGMNMCTFVLPIILGKAMEYNTCKELILPSYPELFGMDNNLDVEKHNEKMNRFFIMVYLISLRAISKSAGISK